MKSLTREWLEYAKNDFYAATLLVDSHKPLFEVIAYHCQQSAEKNLKALLIEHGEAPPRIHDMGLLCKLVSNYHVEFSEHLEDCDRLTPYGVITRYPGSILCISKEQVVRALKTAKRYRNWYINICWNHQINLESALHKECAFCLPSEAGKPGWLEEALKTADEDTRETLRYELESCQAKQKELESENTEEE